MLSTDIEFGSLGTLSRRLDAARTVLVTDAKIRSLYGSSFPDCPVLIIPEGEAAKNIYSLETLYNKLLDIELDRSGAIFAVGGGSVSDLAGFAAATWMRGIDFYVAPTTLLAMVDASIGGKNGIDLQRRKNMVGTFLQPRAVFCDVGLLVTLPLREFASGMAEMIKHGIIDCAAHFEALEVYAAAYASGGRDAISGPGKTALENLITASQRVKTRIVAEDERETGMRRLLNLGHSLGHAIEVATALPHGHCVAAGLGFACYLSITLGLMRPELARRIYALLAAWALPYSIEASWSAMPNASAKYKDSSHFRAAVALNLRADKKRNADSILFALPVDIGSIELRAIPLATIEHYIMEAP